MIGQDNLLVVLRNTSLAPAAMLAPKRRADHACRAEVRLVKLPGADEVIDNGLLLGNSVHLRDKAGVVHHGRDVEVGSHSQEGSETQV